MRRTLFYFSFFFFAFSSEAAPVKAVNGKVAVDGAAVYSQPDFDSDVIDYLHQGTKVPTSTKQYAGQGGMGLFHKIRTPKGKLGYLPDTDVVLPKGTQIETPKDAPPRVNTKDRNKKDQPLKVEKDEETRKSVYLTRYIGGTLAMIDYTEKFMGRKEDAQTIFGGLRMTGPDILFKSPPLDFNVLVSPMAPKYLSDFANGSGSGFLLMTDLAVTMPLYEQPNGLFYYNLGILLNFSDYKVSVGAGSYDSQDLRIGVDIGLGYAYRFSSYAMRADVRYYIEKTLYLGALLSFQAEY